MTDVRRIVSEHRRAVWIIAAGLIVNAALYALVVYPLGQRVHTEEREAGEATRALVDARRAFAEAKGTVSGKKQADAELQRFYGEVLPRDLSAARRTLYPRVEQLARNSDLTDVTGRWEQDAQSRGDLRRLALTVTLTGDYSNIKQFIHEIETASEFMVLESVGVRQIRGESNDLSVMATVATYYRDGGDGN